MASAGAGAYIGVWGRAPSWVQGAEPPVGISGAFKAPPPEAGSSVAFEAPPAEEPNLTLVTVFTEIWRG